MHQDKSQYEEIKRYILGDMTALEKREFSDRMSNDNELAKKVDLQLFGRQLIIGQKLISVREKMTSEYDDFQPTPIWKKLAPVIVIIILIGGGILYAQFKGDDDQASESETVSEQESETQQDTDSPEKQKSETTTTDEEPDKQSAETEKEEPKAKEKTVESPCDTTEIDFKVKISETCEDSATGSISVLKTTMTGGKKPYTAVIAGDTTFTHTSLTKGLQAVTVTDANACSRTKRINIKSTPCAEAKDEESDSTLTTPQADEKDNQKEEDTDNEYWKAPINTDEKVLLKIINNNNHTVFEDSVKAGFQWPKPDGNTPFSYEIRDENNDIISEGVIE